ncbi:MAG: hypothetical protein HY043_06425 [Verrucomicrobia bacterium]|nr:hypothetical protein [Verrucomicrobiota bacterium]
MKGFISLLQFSASRFRALLVTAALAASTVQPKCLARDLTAPTNHPPTISRIADIGTCPFLAIPGILFAVGDDETDSSSLSLSAVSSNEQFVRSADIVFSGTGTNRTLSIPHGTSGG